MPVDVGAACRQPTADAASHLAGPDDSDARLHARIPEKNTAWSNLIIDRDEGDLWERSPIKVFIARRKRTGLRGMGPDHKIGNETARPAARRTAPALGIFAELRGGVAPRGFAEHPIRGDTQLSEEAVAFIGGRRRVSSSLRVDDG